MEDFKNYYCLDGSFIGKNADTIKLLYPMYCSFFGLEPIKDVVTEICKTYGLAVKGNKFIDFNETLAKLGY